MIYSCHSFLMRLRSIKAFGKDLEDARRLVIIGESPYLTKKRAIQFSPYYMVGGLAMGLLVATISYLLFMKTGDKIIGFGNIRTVFHSP